MPPGTRPEHSSILRSQGQLLCVSIMAIVCLSLFESFLRAHSHLTPVFQGTFVLSVFLAPIHMNFP